MLFVIDSSRAESVFPVRVGFHAENLHKITIITFESRSDMSSNFAAQDENMTGNRRSRTVRKLRKCDKCRAAKRKTWWLVM